MSAQDIVDILHQKILPSSARAGMFPATADSGNYLPTFPFTLHSHTFFEWIWCVENCAFLQIKQQVFRLDTGDFFFLPPGEVHADVYTTALKNHQILWCAYYNETINAHLYEYKPINRQQHIAGISAPAPPFISSLLGALQHEWNTRQKYQQPIYSALVQALIHLMLRAFENTADERRGFFPKEVVVHVNRYLNEHFHQPLALTDIACALHISRNYLATLYKQETGMTIGRMLREIRLEEAKKLLLETEMTVQQIAQEVGYSTPEHFNRVFVQQIGVTPGKYGKR